MGNRRRFELSKTNKVAPGPSLVRPGAERKSLSTPRISNHNHESKDSAGRGVPKLHGGAKWRWGEGSSNACFIGYLFPGCRGRAVATGCGRSPSHRFFLPTFIRQTLARRRAAWREEKRLPPHPFASSALASGSSVQNSLPAPPARPKIPRCPLSIWQSDWNGDHGRECNCWRFDA
jgi:hypothetical protein